MKYILKKDLPFAKKGEEIELFDGSFELLPKISYKGYVCNVPSTAIFDWIEEVKPREFYGVISGDATINGFLLPTKTAAEDFVIHDRKKEIIKVREVSE